MVRHCIYCNKEFEKNTKTCSKECRYKLARKTQSITLNKLFNYSTERNCLYCNKTFTPTTGSRVKTCSKECGYKYRSTVQKRNSTLLSCLMCGKQFKNKNYSKNKTCSKECAAALRKKTSIQKYGVENPMQSQEIILKLKENNITTHGVSWGSQIHIPKEVLTLFNDKTFLEDLYNNQNIPIENIASQYNVSGFFVAKKLKECGIVVRPYKGISHEEKELRTFLESLQISFETNKRTLLTSKKELDIYIPSHNLAIEFNGIFYHSEQIRGKYYHINKTNDAEDVGIHLIHIFDDDWKNKKEIIKSRLKRELQIKENVLYARKCVVEEVKYSEISSFLDKYHLQGKVVSSINLILKYNNDIVACMTFGCLRSSLGQKNKEGEYELLRFCSKNTVQGGASKLFKFFVQKYSPKRIISYADRHWTSAIKRNMYDILKFIKKSNGSPGYWYIINNKRVHRFNYRKSELHKKLKIFDNNLSEYDNMLLNGYDRIWGCGNLVYEWRV